MALIFVVTGRFALLNRVLSIILGVLLIGAVGGLIYISVSPGAGERFTEFYVLESEGEAAGYPEEVVLNEEAKVTVGIVNQEYREVSYRIEITIGGEKNGEIGPVVLNHEQKWQQEVSFRPSKVGEKQKVEFLLYKNGQVTPSAERLHLWVDVME